MKKALSIILVLVLMLTAAPLGGFVGLDLPKLTASAATYGDLTYLEYDTYIEITDCDDFATSVDIPSKINGKPVTSIGDGAFYDCIDLESIAIPASVTSIGNGAFSWCDSLIAINLDEKNESYCLLDGVLYNKEKTALIYCTAKKKITEYTIPATVTSISASAFEHCSSLQSITIPDSVTNIDYRAFWCCSSLQSITIPSSVTSIEESAFFGCSALQSITIPDTVTSIETRTFSGCSALQSITIPNSVTSISELAFECCFSLESITIPDSVTSIGNFAFALCRSLTTVNYTGTEKQWKKINIGDLNEDLTSATINFNYAPSCTHSNISVLPAVTATCTERGMTEGKKCSDCGEILEAQREIPAAHSPSDWIVKTKAKVGVKGKEVKNCIFCGKELESREIPAIEKPTKPIANLLLGDVNGDGKIKANDARTALRAAAKLQKLDEKEMKAADIDGNDKVTAAEARKILRFAAKLDKELK